MSEFQHSYSNYLNHILNKSPSKTAYTFSKTERFPKYKPEEPLSYPQTPSQALHSMRHTFNYQNKQPRKDLYEIAKNSNKHQHHLDVRPLDLSVQKEVDYLLKKIQRKQQRRKSPVQPSQLSPYTKTNAKYHYSPNKAFAENFNRSGVSPSKQKGYSPRKRLYTQVIENHPSKNISVAGYYPVGIQLNAQGRYSTSRIKNVAAPKFSPLPSKSRTNKDSTENIVGPGSYNIFSEFGA